MYAPNVMLYQSRKKRNESKLFVYIVGEKKTHVDMISFHS